MTPTHAFSEPTADALKRSPSQIEPFNGLLEVLDFTLVSRLQVADGRHGLGNQPPRTLGSSVSPLLAKLSGSHYDVQATPEQWRTVWLWIESAAPYAGCYAALRNAETWERAQRALAMAQKSGQSDERCVVCHQPKSPLEMPYDYWRNSRRLEQWKPSVKLLDRPIGPNERVIVPDDPIAKFGTALLYNSTRPEESPVLLAPLAKAAGGWECRPGVYKDRKDPHYQEQLARIRQAKTLLDAEPRYATPGFRPNRQYVREMKKCGVLPDDSVKRMSVARVRRPRRGAGERFENLRGLHQPEQVPVAASSLLMFRTRRRIVRSDVGTSVSRNRHRQRAETHFPRRRAGLLSGRGAKRISRHRNALKIRTSHSPTA